MSLLSQIESQITVCLRVAGSCYTLLLFLLVLLALSVFALSHSVLPVDDQGRNVCAALHEGPSRSHRSAS